MKSLFCSQFSQFLCDALFFQLVFKRISDKIFVNWLKWFWNWLSCLLSAAVAAQKKILNSSSIIFISNAAWVSRISQRNRILWVFFFSENTLKICSISVSWIFFFGKTSLMLFFFVEDKVFPQFPVERVNTTQKWMELWAKQSVQIYVLSCNFKLVENFHFFVTISTISWWEKKNNEKKIFSPSHHHHDHDHSFSLLLQRHHDIYKHKHELEKKVNRNEMEEMASIKSCEI